MISISIPNLNELYCAICESDWPEVRDSSAKSDFHWQTIKCRLILAALPEVIASPIFGSKGFINVLAKKEMFECGTLKSNLQQLHAKISDYRSVTVDIYRDCLQYKALFSLAPEWNKVGSVLVQGRHFLSAPMGLNGIKMNVSLSDSTMNIKLETVIVKIPTFKLDDLCLPEILMKGFLVDKESVINVSHFGSYWVYVLPSMKKGKLMSVSKIFPKCSFKSYDEIRRHWKNMYGYRLPKSEENIMFCEVYFPWGSHCYFTYPHICLASRPLNFYCKANNENVMRKFQTDLRNSMPTVCGHEIKVSCNFEKLNTQLQAPTIAPEFSNKPEASVPTKSAIPFTPYTSSIPDVKLTFSETYLKHQHNDSNIPKLLNFYAKGNNDATTSSFNGLSEIEEIHDLGSSMQSQSLIASVETKYPTNSNLKRYLQQFLSKEVSKPLLSNKTDLNPASETQGGSSENTEYSLASKIPKLASSKRSTKIARPKSCESVSSFFKHQKRRADNVNLKN